MSGATGSAKWNAVATKTTEAWKSRRRNEPTTQVSSNGVGGGYRAEGTDREYSSDKSAKSSGTDTGGSVTEEDTETVGGGREVSNTRTATARGSQESGVGLLPGCIAAGRSDTWLVTSEAADKAGVGGRHGERRKPSRRVLSSGG